MISDLYILYTFCLYIRNLLTKVADLFLVVAAVDPELAYLQLCSLELQLLNFWIKRYLFLYLVGHYVVNCTGVVHQVYI